MEQFVITKSKNKNLSSRKELELLDKQELIDKVLQLEAHTIQLKNIIKKVDNVKSDKKPGKGFDFAQCNKRHILLKFYYLGWNYSGFVEQEDTINTIEHHIFHALKRSCLIEQRETCNYHRCGRTDKGVSAYSQVISLDIRSRLGPEEQTNLKEELSYCKILNRILPKDIRCTAWAPVADEYSARFDCKTRSYRYYFPRGDLDIEAMNRAAGYLVGHHDFRNLCKMDVANGVVTFERTVIDAKIVLNDQDTSKQSGYDMCQLIIKSQAFLWHQIRCIMGILLLVGQKKEDPEIINYLFDIEKCPRKPQYNLAHELPLNLFYCHYDDVEWFYDESEVEVVIKTLQEEWTLNAIKAEMIKSIIDDLSTHCTSEEGFNYQSDCLIQGVQAKIHQPLIKRITCESLENRIKHFEKKRRIEIKNPSKENT